MELRAVSYEERRSRFFKDQIKSREGIMESIKSYGISDEAKHIALSEEGEKIQFFTDALNALYWIKIEYDEEGKLVAFPSEGEYALFCRKDGGIFLDEVCADDIEDGERGKIFWRRAEAQRDRQLQQETDMKIGEVTLDGIQCEYRLRTPVKKAIFIGSFLHGTVQDLTHEKRHGVLI